MHTMEYYSAFKKKGNLTHATTWTNLENTTQSKCSQSHKGNYYMSSLIQGASSDSERKWNGVYQGLRGEKTEGLLFLRCRVSIL